MSQDLANLYIKVDSKGVVTASKDLDNLTGKSRQTEKATESVTKSFTKLQAVVVALASSYALLKMAQYIKDTAMLAARYETLGVVMRVVGENAGYTEAQMDKFARGLQKTGIAMIESRNTLARMIQAQIDLTDSQKLARIAQNAAVIGNMNSSAAFEHMIYGLQTGHPRILRTIGLNVNFDASVRALADSLGIKRKAMSEVQVMQGRVNAVIKAGILIEGAYEGAMETAGKKLTSFIRYVDDFKVKMGEAFGPATVMLVDAATQAMKDMQEQISRPEAQEALRELSSQLAIVIVQLGKDLPKAIESTTNAIAKLTAIYNSLPEGVVGAAGVGLIVRILLGSTPAGALAAGLYLISKQVDKLNLSFQKDWQAGMLEAAKEFEVLLMQGGKFRIIFDEQGINQFEKMQEMLAKGAPTRLDFALEDPDKYFGEMVVEAVYEQTDKMKERYAKYYAALEEMEDMAYIKTALRERERLKELEPFIAVRHEIWLSAYKAEEARLDEYASYRIGQEKSITEQIRAIRMTDKTFALAALKEKYENYKNFTDDLIGLELWRAAKEKEIRESGYDDMENAMQGWANSFSSTLNDMLWGAEVTFRSILESFAKMITQMMIQKQIIDPMFGGSSGWFGATLGWLSGLGGGGAPGGTGPITVAAQGGIFPDGISGYSNQIVNKPTQFAFARGAGLMGERGPEAIMPLTRTPSGDLGVKAENGKGSGSIIVIVANDAQSFADMVQRNPESIVSVVGDAMQDRTGLRDIMRDTI
jgi:hypothetical protein